MSEVKKIGQITVDQTGLWCRIVHEGEVYVGKLTSAQHSRTWQGEGATTINLRNNKQWRWCKSLPADHAVEWVEGEGE